MGYYANNLGKLYMGTATATDSASLPAHGSDVLREVLLTGAITPAARGKAVGTFRVTNDSAPRAIGGAQNDRSWTGNIVIDRDEQTHLDFVSDADATGAVYRNWRFDYDDGTQRKFRGFVSLLEEETIEASEEAAPHRSNWTVTQDGADIP